MNEINKEERMQGLSGQQVSESKAKYGTNELAKKETESLWSMFIGAFDDIWIKVLCAALALKVILAVLGIFVPALSGGNPQPMDSVNTRSCSQDDANAKMCAHLLSPFRRQSHQFHPTVYDE